jgi:hypothetical protein
MAEHTLITTNAHEEAREEAPDREQFLHDVAGGELDTTTVQKRDTGLPAYQHEGDSQITLDTDGNPPEPDDVSEEDLATLRRVSDRIPMSAWLAP